MAAFDRIPHLPDVMIAEMEMDYCLKEVHEALKRIPTC